MKLKFANSEYNLEALTADEMKKNLSENEETEYRCFGYCDDMNKTIAVSKETPIPSIKQVLFHEIVHALLSETGDQELSADERFVDAFSKQLCTFLSGNNLDRIYKYLKTE